MGKESVTRYIKMKDNKKAILKKYFSHCFDKNGNFDFEKFKQDLSIGEVNFSKESYGMDWLGKSYARLLANDEATTLLKEDEKWNSKEENAKSENLLIKGDNLEVLKHLSNAYYEKIKMIYIDPPYNTGSDGFVYSDDRKFTVEELQELAGIDEDKAKRILSFTQSKSNSHSAWLTFMYPRLYIAKQLLREDGVIFVSIDDNEVAQLRLLMDEIFGEENFIGDIVRKTKSMTGDEGTGLNYQHEFLILYGKNKEKVFLLGNEKEFNGYSNPDGDPNGDWVSGDPSAKSGSEVFSFGIKNPHTGNIDFPPAGRYWAFSEETLNSYIKSGKIKFKKKYKENERGFIFKRYKKELKTNHNPVNSLFAIDNSFMNQIGTKELQIILGGEFFKNPKPIIFIKKIIEYTSQPNDLILDFFAGSGTTGDAVMQLNAEDGGNRKYILVQLPEPIDPKKNKTAYDFVKNELKAEEPTIFEICKERLIRAAKKIKDETIKAKIEEKQKEIKKLQEQLNIDGNKDKIKELKKDIKKLKNQDLGFKIFETMPIWEDYDIDADEYDERLSFFDESKLTTDDIKSLLLTWKTYDGLPLTQPLQEIDLGQYAAYYAEGNSGNKLYLMDKGFTTNNLKTLLERIDEDKKFNPTSIIAFGYNFESKHLREIGENIKSYANKKNIDIDFITRY